VAEEENAEEIVSELSQNGIHASVIGEIAKPNLGRKIVTRTDEQIELVRRTRDDFGFVG